MTPVHVIGGGLAGSEAAWQLAAAGVPVVLHEMRPTAGPRRMSPTSSPSSSAPTPSAPTTRENNAVGLLHEEMRRAGSLIMRAADAHKLPAGGALAVDRDGFAAASRARSQAIRSSTIGREEIAGLPPADWDERDRRHRPPHLAALAEAIRRLTGQDALAFFDAIAPIVHRETHRLRAAPGSSRATTRPAPAATAPTTSTARSTKTNTRPSSRRCSPARRPSSRSGRSTPYFEGCLPIEVMAARGADTLRFGPMKPVGLTDPRTGRRP